MRSGSRLLVLAAVLTLFTTSAVAFAAQRSSTRTGATRTAARVLSSFSVFTEAEKPFIYEDTKTWLQDGVWPDPVRVADGEGQRIVYVFEIPSDVDGAYCQILVGNQFVISVAGDDGGKPGEFREEINTVSLLGHKVYQGENYRDWVFDLTAHLRKGAARKVYVALEDADPSDGYGAAIAWVKVVALDDAGKRAFLHARQSQNQFVREEHETVFYVMANGGKEEARYLYEVGGKQQVGLYRTLEGESYVIYHLPATEKELGLYWYIEASRDFLISIAPEKDGKPGEFVPVARGRDVFEPGEMKRGWHWIHTLPIDQRLVEDGGCYVKIQDAEPDQEPAGVAISVGQSRVE
ncbi:MAG: hypothetical protein JXA57_14690 [Armatimonadetes bacterium]|nr:hypothetical protein [Armatimonadota bacterium]